MAASSESSPPLRVGFLGAGRMCQALSQGMVSAGLVVPQNIIASDLDTEILKYTAKMGASTTTNNVEVVKASDVVVIAVKPHIVAPVLKEVGPSITSNHLVISIAAGIDLKTLEGLLPKDTRVVRVMPNTPALVRAGASVYSPGTRATPQDAELTHKLFLGVGICMQLPEKHLDCVAALSGAGPAYAFLAIEALADGGVKMGLPRDLAIKLASQTLMGAAKLQLDTGTHPGELKDGVCSPGGCTIAGVHALEKGGYRASLISAVEAATIRTKELGNS